MTGDRGQGTGDMRLGNWEKRIRFYTFFPLKSKIIPKLNNNNLSLGKMNKSIVSLIKLHDFFFAKKILEDPVLGVRIQTV